MTLLVLLFLFGLTYLCRFFACLVYSLYPNNLELTYKSSLVKDACTFLDGLTLLLLLIFHWQNFR